MPGLGEEHVLNSGRTDAGHWLYYKLTSLMFNPMFQGQNIVSFAYVAYVSSQVSRSKYCFIRGCLEKKRLILIC